MLTHHGGDNLHIGWEVRHPETKEVFWSDGHVVWEGRHSDFVEDVEMTDG